MRVLDLFAGIGGLALGLEWAGMETAGLVEIEPFCRSVLAFHWPSVPMFSDVREVTGDEVAAACGAVDVVAGGPPCQPASVAGRRRGAADDRWLWPEYLRVVREVRPRWVVAENPLGIASLEPLGLDWICGELEGAGYSVWPVVLGADDVGAPHRRKRVWVIGRLGLADAKRGGLREQSGRSGGTGGAGTAKPGGVRETVAYSDGAGLEIRKRQRGYSRAQQPSAQRADSARWPARPGEQQHEWEAPRLLELGVGRDLARFSEWMDSHVIMGYGKKTPTRSAKGVCAMRRAADEEVLRQDTGGSNSILQKEVLQFGVHGACAHVERADVSGASPAFSARQSRDMREVRVGQDGGPPSHRRECREQSKSERDDAVPVLSHDLALGERENAAAKGAVFCLRASSATSWDVSEALVPLFEVWRSASNKEKARLFCAVGPSLERRLRQRNRAALRALGNAVVPHCACVIGKAIIEAEARCH